MRSDLAVAISIAEGFPVKGSIPQRANNPGDLVLGDKGFGTLGEGITIFQDVETGWAALEHQLQLIRDHRSSVYWPQMTIRDMGQKYAPHDAVNWSTNVLEWYFRRGRHYTLDTPLRELL